MRPAIATQPAVARRSLLVCVGVLLAGCSSGSGDDGADGDEDGEGSRRGDDGSTTDSSGENPATGEVEQRGDLDLASPAFADGEQIPRRYGKDAENVNPPLLIGGVPDDAASLALVMDDPDAVEPAGHVWDHWIVWNVEPDRREIPENWQPTTAVEGTNDFDSVGYDGPAPPDAAHRYRFKLFALDETLALSTSTSARELGRSMDGHVLAQTQLDGTYPA